MDGARFDGLARRLATGVSRRGALRAIGAAVAGGAVAEAVHGGEAKKGSKKPPIVFCPSFCSRKKDCCKGKTCCGGACVDPIWDDANCGACGNVCSGNRWCVDSECVCQATFCGPNCCAWGEACRDRKSGTCGVCEAGDGMESAASVIDCGGNGGYGCVTSVNDVVACASRYGLCMDCQSDDECTATLNDQAVCIPTGDRCAQWGASRACVRVDAGGFGGDDGRGRSVAQDRPGERWVQLVPNGQG